MDASSREEVAVEPNSSFQVAKDIEERCFQLAEEALKEKEVPVGCVMHLKIAAKQIDVSFDGRNRVNEVKDATRHAEMVCIDQMVDFMKQNNLPVDDWSGVTVYVTVEPCIMCARALKLLSVSKIYYGCCNDRFGGCTSIYKIFQDDKMSGSNDIALFPGSLNGERAVNLLRSFYTEENPNAPIEKRKIKKSKVD